MVVNTTPHDIVLKGKEFSRKYMGKSNKKLLGPIEKANNFDF